MWGRVVRLAAAVKTHLQALVAREVEVLGEETVAPAARVEVD